MAAMSEAGRREFVSLLTLVTVPFDILLPVSNHLLFCTLHLQVRSIVIAHIAARADIVSTLLHCTGTFVSGLLKHGVG